MMQPAKFINKFVNWLQKIILRVIHYCVLNYNKSISFVKNLFYKIKNFLEYAVNHILESLENVIKIMINVYKHILNRFRNVIKKIIDFYNHVLDKLKTYFKKIINFYKKINKISKEKHLHIDKRDEKYITDSKAALMNEISPLSDKIIVTILILIFIGFIWAYFGEIDQTVSGTGVVIPSSQVKIIQSLDGGILKEIYVKDGEIVKKDQKLLTLDDTRYRAEYQQLYEQYLALLATLARLTAETQDKNEIAFPEELKDRSKLQETEKRLFLTRRNALNNEITVLQQSLDFANKEIKMYQPLIKTGVSSQLELLRAERSANELQSRIYEKIGDFREAAWAELNAKQADLAAAKERLSGLRDKMLRTTIVSPVHGIIKRINIVTMGGVIQPAVDIMEIVPLQDSLLIRTKINSADIGFIHLGAVASVKIDAYDYAIYGDLEGKVEYISADIIEEPRDRSSGVSHHYIVDVRTDQDYLLHNDKKYHIIPGMTATIQITVGKRTLLQYMLKPIIKAKTEALRER